MNADLSIRPIHPLADGNTGDRWMAVLDVNGSPAYDGTGATVEEALASLVMQIGTHLVAQAQGRP